LLAWHALPPQVSPLGQIGRAGNAVALATSPDGKWLVSGGDDSQATVWDLETGEIVETLPGNFGTMYAMEFSADSQLLATANMTGTVKVWRVKDWSLEGALLDAKRQVRCVAFSPDGRWLASGGTDRKLLITDLQSWETAAEKGEQDLWVEGVAFSPDGSRLYTVTGSWDPKDQPVAATLTAWKVMAGKDKFELEPIKTIKTHSGSTDNLAVTPDGLHIVTAGSGAGAVDEVAGGSASAPFAAQRSGAGDGRRPLGRPLRLERANGALPGDVCGTHEPRLRCRRNAGWTIVDFGRRGRPPALLARPQPRSRRRAEEVSEERGG
jgi:hypothetical protein